MPPAPSDNVSERTTLMAGPVSSLSPLCFLFAVPLRSLPLRHSAFLPATTHRKLRHATHNNTCLVVPHAVLSTARNSSSSSSQSELPSVPISTTTKSSSASSPSSKQPRSDDEQQSQYVPLHVHSDFSLLDGASQLPSLVQRAKELGVPALSLTDHGVLYGAVQLVRSCAGTSVKPIIGNEMYLVNAELPLPDGDDGEGHRNAPTVKSKPKRYHLIVLAKNTTGYRNLVKLTTMAHLDGRVGTGMFARPCINKAQLYAHREGLIVSSACLGGEIPQAILNDDINAARTVATWYRDTFGPDFYLEIQDHGSAEDRKVNPVIVQLGQQLGIPIIATNDSHFTSCLDAEAHDAMICIQTGKRLTDENRLHYAGNEYFKSFDEMRQCFVDHLPPDVVDQALKNTLGVSEKVETYDLFGATRIPDFPTPPEFGDGHDEYLRHVAREGLADRVESRLRSGLITRQDSKSDDSAIFEEYRTRLEEELDMICRMGFASYFLVVWDYIKYAREVNIPVGPGRGSAAGSLVAFALRITDVDPLEFNLLFERFLNPERKSMPDIDTDFSVEGRERLIAYVTERYGRDRVAQIITFNRLTSKAVLKDVARVHEVPYAEADRLAKMIPVVRGKPATLSALLGENSPSPDFKRSIQRNPDYSIWLDKAQRIEGANKTYGIHAAGVVISATSLDDIVPLSRAKHGETITQYAMEDVEALGLLKMDFLGLKNLSVIETALRFINEGRRRDGLESDFDFSVDHLPLDDANTYRLLAEGELDGIFQLDASAGMRAIVRELRPSNLEDISSILALYRPGPLDAGLIPKFIRRKHGVEPIEYDHPLLKPILKETYGIMVYQEQIMRIARDLAGYSLGQADILRRAMGKKKTKDMEREKPKFVDGAVQNGVPQKTAIALFDQMLKFAEYCFNKSHSTAYAYLTYQTAYLKANYPVEYCAALLRCNMTQSDKLVRYLADANASGVSVLPPSVNRSDIGFTVDWVGSDEEEGKRAIVLFGLEAVKTVGESVGSSLIAERDANGRFLSIIDLIERVDMRVLNKRAMGALIQAGAFDELHPNRKVLLRYLDEMLLLRRKLRDKRRRRESKGPLSPEDEEQLCQEKSTAWDDVKFKLETDSTDEEDFSAMERLAGEKATLGFYASGHPLYEMQHVEKILGCTKVAHIVGESHSQDEDSQQLGDSEAPLVAEGSDVMILSCVTELKRLTTAKGKKMGKWMIEDVSGRVPAIVFPEAYELMEQTVEYIAPDNEAEADSGSNPPEVKQVVEEDARVIVWGKVDRESSGSAQIIVDDVQRVEDVNILMATAVNSENRTASIDLHMLQHKAAKMLEVQLVDDKSLTFLDPNGMRRRRRRKVVPLSEKNRVPLILQCRCSDGSVEQYLNAGNMVRFPHNSAEYLAPLEQNTGFKFRMLSVGADILTNEFEGQEPETVVTEEKMVVQNETTQVGEEIEDQFVHALEEEHEPMPLSSTEMQSQEPIIGSLNGAADAVSPSEDHEKVSEFFKLMDIDEEEFVTSLENLRDNSTPRSDPMLEQERDVEKILKQTEELRHNNFVGERQRAVLSQYEERTSRDPTMSQAFSQIHSLNDFSCHEAFHDVQADKAYQVTRAKASTLPTREKVRELEKDRETSVNGIGILQNEEKTFDGIRSFKDEIVIDSPVGAPIVKPTVEDVPDLEVLIPQESEHLEDTFHQVPSFREEEDVSDDEVESSSYETEQQNVDLDLTDGLVVEFDEAKLGGVLDAISLVSADTVTRYCGKSVAGPFSVQYMSGLNLEKLTEKDVSLKITGSVAYSEGANVHVLVDVKEKTATGKRQRVRSFGPVAVIMTCSSDGNNEIPKVNLRTKKDKKRLESFVHKLEKCFDDCDGDRSIFSSASSTHESDSSVADESSSSEDIGAGTKKKRKRKPKNDTTVYVRTSEVGIETSIDLPAAEKNARFADGGELLLFMSRASEVCARRVVRSSEESPWLATMEWVCVDERNGESCQHDVMAGINKGQVKHVDMKTQLMGLTFDELKIAVVAEVHMMGDDNVQRKHRLIGEFITKCADAKLMKKLRVVEDNHRLFDKEDIARRVAHVAKAIKAG